MRILQYVVLFLITTQFMSGQSLRWRRFIPGGDGVPPCVPASCELDSLDHLILFFPGYSDYPEIGRHLFYFDYLDETVDSFPITGGIAPIWRGSYVSYYNEHSRNFILFGGHRGDMGMFNDLWIYNLDTYTWDSINVFGASPPVRCHSAWVYNRNRNSMILWGGYQGGDTLRTDLWRLDLKQLYWQELTYTGYGPPYAGCAYILDTTRNEMLLWGGITTSRTLSNRLFALNLDSLHWREITQSGDIPSPRRHMQFAWGESPYIYLYGGDEGSSGTAPLGDTYRLNIETYSWEEVYPDASWYSAPTAKSYYAFKHIPHESKIVIFCGMTGLWDGLNEFHYLEWDDASSVFVPNIDSELAKLHIVNRNGSIYLASFPKSFIGEKYQMDVYNITGKLITRYSGGIPPSGFIEKLQNRLENGVYIARIFLERQSIYFQAKITIVK
ncbi:MAG: hypothetical protein J7M38_07765 [Armatimonadetes bacterium]|nr:hypothetical protein [Armatimonadota bacterium]